MKIYVYCDLASRTIDTFFLCGIFFLFAIHCHKVVLRVPKFCHFHGNFVDVIMLIFKAVPTVLGESTSQWA